MAPPTTDRGREVRHKVTLSLSATEHALAERERARRNSPTTYPRVSLSNAVRDCALVELRKRNPAAAAAPATSRRRSAAKAGTIRARKVPARKSHKAKARRR